MMRTSAICAACLGLVLATSGCKKDDLAQGDPRPAPSSSASASPSVAPSDPAFEAYVAKIKEVEVESSKLSKDIQAPVAAASAALDKPDEMKKAAPAYREILAKVEAVNAGYAKMTPPADLKEFHNASTSAANAAFAAMEELGNRIAAGDGNGFKSTMQQLQKVIVSESDKVIQALDKAGYDVEAFLQRQDLVKRK